MTGPRPGWPGRLRAGLLGGALVLAGLVALAGCGSSSPAAITPSASSTLAGQLGAIRAAAGADPARARALIGQFQNTVTSLASQGQITAPKASAILTSAAAVLAQLSPAPSPVAPPAVSPSPTAGVVAPVGGTTGGSSGGNGPGGGKKGKGKGGGGGD